MGGYDELPILGGICNLQVIGLSPIAGSITSPFSSVDYWAYTAA